MGKDSMEGRPFPVDLPTQCRWPKADGHGHHRQLYPGNLTLRHSARRWFRWRVYQTWPRHHVTQASRPLCPGRWYRGVTFTVRVVMIDLAKLTGIVRCH